MSLTKRYEDLAYELEDCGYFGSDASPFISLYEYEYLIKNSGDGVFDTVVFGKANTDKIPNEDEKVFYISMIYAEDIEEVVERYKEEIADHYGVTEEQLNHMPFILLVDFLNGYNGYVVEPLYTRYPDFSLVEMERKLERGDFC